jgi:TP901 family phage tail tape measure protein
MSFTSSGDNELAVNITASDQGASEAFDGVAESAGGVKTAVAGASAVLAGAAVAALGKATMAAANFEQAMVEVEKVTSQATAEKLSQSIRDMATEIPLAQEKLAGLAADAGRFGIEGPKNIEKFTRSVAKMSTATNLSAQEAGESLAKLAELTNTPISEVENLGSAINSLSNNFATSSQEIVDSMKRSAGALSQMGMSQTEIAGMSAALNEVSESSERAGTRMRRLAQEMMSPKKVGELSSALGMSTAEFKKMREEAPTELMLEMAESMKEGGKEADALRNALSTTSRQALAAMGQNLEGTREALEKSNKSYEEGTSLQKEFEASTSTFNKQLKLLQNQLRNIAISMGNKILPVLGKGLKRLRPLVSKFADFNKRMNGMPAIIATVTAAVVGLTGVFTALGVSITATVLPAIALIAGLTAAGVALYKAWQTNFGGIRTALKDTAKTIKQTFAQNRAELNKLGNTVSKFGDLFTRVLTTVKKVLGFVVNSFIVPILKRLTKIWTKHFGDIAAETNKTLSAIKTVITVTLNAIEAFWKVFGDEIKTYTKAVFNAIELVIGQAMDAILTVVKTSLALLRGDWKQALSYIEGYYKRTFGRMLEFLKGTVLKGLKATLGLIADVFKLTFKGIRTLLLGSAGIVTGLFSGILSGAEDLKKDLDSVLSNIKQAFTGIFSDIKDSVLGTVSSMKSLVIDSVTSLGSDMVDEIKSSVNGMVSTFNSVLPDELSIPELSVGGQTLGPDSGPNVKIPEVTVGGQSINMPSLPKLAEGGIVDSATIAMIGEAGNEAVVPLDKLNSYLDTAYEAGTATASVSPMGGGSSGQSGTLTARLKVEGDGALADMIREEAELVVESNEQDKQNRLGRLG